MNRHERIGFHLTELLAALLDKQLTDLSALSVPDASPDPAPTTAALDVTESSAPEPEAESGHTLADIRALLTSYRGSLPSASLRSLMRDLLDRHGLQALPDLPEASYDAFYAELATSLDAEATVS